MCIAIWKPAGAKVPIENLEECFRLNSDGAGFAAADGSSIVMQKGFFKFGKFIKAYSKFEELPCLVHFRVKTHGMVDTSNCHPFLFAKGHLAAIHNGTINIKCSNTKKSDTWHFVQQVLDPIARAMDLGDPAIRYLIEQSIGWSKLAVMDVEGNVVIYNEDKGHWNSGMWFSNHTYTLGGKGLPSPYESDTNRRSFGCGGEYWGGSTVGEFNRGTMPMSRAESIRAERRRKLYPGSVEQTYARQVDAEVARFVNEGNSAADAEARRSASGTATQRAILPENSELSDAHATTGTGQVTTRGEVITLREYGEEDPHIEDDIKTAMVNLQISRKEALAILKITNITQGSAYVGED
jgi:hypothetical protein